MTDTYEQAKAALYETRRDIDVLMELVWEAAVEKYPDIQKELQVLLRKEELLRSLAVQKFVDTPVTVP